MRLPPSLDPAVRDVAAALAREAATPAEAAGHQVDHGVGYVVDDELVDDLDYGARPRHAAPRRSSPKGDQSEAELTTNALDWLNAQPDTFARKVHPDQFGGKGEPDIDGCTRGRTFKIELKVGSKRPNRAQETSLRAWQRAGATVGFARSLDQVQAIHARIDDPTYRYTGAPGAPAAPPEE